MTPAGTLISLNMIVGIFGGTLLNKVIVRATKDIDEVWLRLSTLLIMLLALALISKRARDEWRTSKAAKAPTAVDEPEQITPESNDYNDSNS